MTAREAMERDLKRLREQRSRYALAASATEEAAAQDRRRSRVDRLSEEIDALEQALANLDGDDTTPISLGPLSPIRAVDW